MTQEKKNSIDTIDILISTFLITYKDGISFNKLDNAYYDINGEHIPYAKYGFSNLQSLLNALPSVSLNGSWVKAIPTKKIMHIHELVAEQKSCAKGRRPPHRRSYNQIYNTTRSGNYGFQHTGNYGFLPTGNYGFQQPRNYGFQQPSNYGFHQPRNNNYNGYRNAYNKPNNSIKNSIDNTNGWNSQPNGFKNFDDSHIMKTKWNDQPPCKPLLNQNNHQPQKATHDVPIKSLEESVELNPKDKLPKMVVPLSEGALLRLKMLFKRKTNGMSSEDVIKYYSQIFPEYKDDLDWQAMNHESLDSLLKTTPAGLFSEAYSLSGHVMYFPGILASSSLVNNLESTNVIHQPDMGDDLLATNYDTFTALPLKQLLCNNQILVHMAEIYTPNRFYLNPSENNILDNLMKEIDIYCSNSKKCQVIATDLNTDMPVFVLHSDGAIYRATIIDVSDSIQVFLVDYGTTCVVTIEDIFRIPKKFLELPIQAFEANLDNVKSLTCDEWQTDDAAAWLMKKTPTQFTATIVDYSENGVKVVLDTDQESLNEGIVLAKLARTCVQCKYIDQTPLEKLADSLEMSSLNGSESKLATQQAVPSDPVGIFSSDELMQLSHDMKAPLIVRELQFQADAQVDNFLKYVCHQREICLRELMSSPEREDLFDYVQSLFEIIRLMRHIKDND